MKDWQEYFKTAIGLSAMSSVWSADHLAKEIAIALQSAAREQVETDARIVENWPSISQIHTVLAQTIRAQLKEKADG